MPEAAACPRTRQRRGAASRARRQRATQTPPKRSSGERRRPNLPRRHRKLTRRRNRPRLHRLWYSTRPGEPRPRRRGRREVLGTSGAQIRVFLSGGGPPVPPVSKRWLHASAARDLEHVARHVRRPRRAEHENAAGGLFGVAFPPERDGPEQLRFVPHIGDVVGEALDDGAAVDVNGGVALGETARHSRVDHAKGYSVAADAHGAPFFGHGLGQADDARLGERVVGLANVAVEARRRRDVDDAAVAGRQAARDFAFAGVAEVRRRGADHAKRRRAVALDDGIELRVRHLVQHAVPEEARVVHQHVDATVRLGALRHQDGGEVRIYDRAADRDGLAARRFDLRHHALRHRHV
mmetsp:Transcript_8151/g.28893  ORF Transcript_8151/g.28893 Transcript_8151/m.28893 type:complete len:351 (+) Transcript_8151:92-1144(+)